jgi:hypothetical protein
MVLHRFYKTRSKWNQSNNPVWEIPNKDSLIISKRANNAQARVTWSRQAKAGTLMNKTKILKTQTSAQEVTEVQPEMAALPEHYKKPRQLPGFFISSIYLK